MPCAYRTLLGALLGEVELGIYFQWFDTIFVISAVVGAVVKTVHQVGGAQSLAGSFALEDLDESESPGRDL